MIVALALAIVFSLPAPVLQATPSLQDATATPEPQEESADAPANLATASAVTDLSNQFGRTIITARNNTFLVDSAPPLGHPSEEMNPVEAMLASLATCGLVVYEATAQELDIPLTAATFTVQGDFDARGLSGAADVDPRVQEFRAHLDLEGPDADQAAALFEQWSLHCPIYNTLVRATDIEVSHKLMGEGTALLDITFTYNVPTDEFQAEVSPLAEQFAAADGLVWKIWALDEENSRFSGLLLFEDDAAVQAFLEGELAATIAGHPALSDFEITPYSIMAAETMITGGPLR